MLAKKAIFWYYSANESLLYVRLFVHNIKRDLATKLREERKAHLLTKCAGH